VAHLGGTASIEIYAPLQQVWEAVEDVLKAPEWENGVLSMDALEKDDQGRATLVEVENDAKVRTIKAEVRFDYGEGPTRLSWSQERGDLKRLDGHWLLEDLGGGRTKATYMIDGDPGRVLGMLVRGPVNDYITSVLVNGRPGELKGWVEGS
jgi:ribosome-associated toxin RatA of RatAB toxin-antitoxin module